ncbi:hypothetical protein [Diaphorobacter ruginosibacter]|uniref:CopD family copper resistance protein n=1 Tax=Diaphorobacter ruginosibacter TaxID=1715720 RepID=UPI00333F4512
MTYPVLLTIHLFAALFFIGTVFFEVLMLEGIRKKIPREVMRQVEIAIGNRARRIMPWVLLALFSAGIGMALTRYSGLLAAPLQSHFALMLWLKIALATSVFGHFLTAMTLRRKGKLHSGHFRVIHLSVFTHMVAIVLLAKWMFYAG